MRTALIIVFFACIVLVFFFDVLLGPNLFLDANPFHYDPWQTYASEDDLARKTYRTDSFTTYLPRRVLLSESIESGRLPLWNPYIFAGTPFFADPQSRVLYPIELLLTRVDPIRAMGYDVAIHVFLAMIGMFLFLRAIDLTRLGAVIGGCSYAFSSFFYVRYGDPTLIASAAWIPFFFYGYELAKRHGRLGTLLLVGFFTMGYLAGFPQVLVLGIGALVIYSVWLSLDRPGPARVPALKRTGQILGIAGILSMLLVSVQMIPFIEFFRESVGLHYTFEQLKAIYVAPPILLLRGLFPGLFGNPLEGTDWSDLPRAIIHPYHPEFTVYCGIGALILALVSLRMIYQSPRLKVFLTLLVLSVALAVSSHVLRIGYALLPVLRVAKVSRVSVVACFVLSAMSGIGLTAISRKRDTVRKYLPLVVICVVGLMLVFSLAFELAGESVVEKLTEKARSIPDDQWETIQGQTRSGRVREWAAGDQSGWLTYERKQLRWGVILVSLSAVLIWVAARLPVRRKRLSLVFGLLVAGVLIFDIVSIAKTYYVSQSPGSLRETEGISVLRNVLGAPGKWRIRSIRPTLEEMTVLPANTNQVFEVHSIDGTSTIYPKSYAALKTAQLGTEATTGSPLNRRTWLASDLDNLMGVRFLTAPRNAPRYASPSVLKAISAVAESPFSLGMIEIGGETRLALRQEPGDSLTFAVGGIPSDTLMLAVGFESGGGTPGDSVFFHLDFCAGPGLLRYRQGFDLLADGGSWYPAVVDVSSLRGSNPAITASVTSTHQQRDRSIKAGWSRFEFVSHRSSVVPTSDGYRVDLASGGAALSVHLSSASREVPLEIQFDDGSRSHRWVAFLTGMRSRWMMIDLRGRKRTGLVLRSDSTFSVEQCRQIWRGWTQDFDRQLIYDADMCVYENAAAVEKGVCIDSTAVEREDSDQATVLRLRSLKNVDAVKCGTCEIVAYEPERVVLEVSANRDCYTLFQDMCYPGWKAHIDGEEVEILKTDLGIRALRLPQGKHTVVMTFRPRTLYIGLVLTCLGLVLTVAYAVVTLRPCLARRERA